MNTNGLVMGAVVDEIRPLGIVEGMELEEYLTTRQAWELARDMGYDVSRDAITQAAYSGKIPGARKMGEHEKAPWLLSRKGFLFWVENKKPRGRPSANEEEGT